MSIKFVLLFLLISSQAYCQLNDSLFVNINKLRVIKENNIYSATIKNNSDSPICILHSIFIGLNEESPFALALFSNSDSTENYNLYYSEKDAEFDVERTLYDGVVLLPRQIINFKFSTSSRGIRKSLFFEFIELPDFCYKELKIEMRKTATWYFKYKRIGKTIKLP